MSYACGEFYFGFNLHEKTPAQMGLTEDELEELIEEKEVITMCYQERGDEVPYIGVSVGGVDEASQMNQTEIFAMIAQLQSAVQPNSPALIELINLIREIVVDPDVPLGFKTFLGTQRPELFMVWSTS